jgi:hypothetical protein
MGESVGGDANSVTTLPDSLRSWLGASDDLSCRGPLGRRSYQPLKEDTVNMSNRAKLMIAAVSTVGAVSLAGSAFTASGVTNNAGSTQFVGGTVSQSVTGATLSSVAYSFGDAPANTAVHSALLTFADANTDAKTPTVAFSGGNAVAFTCTAIEATGHTSTCTTDGADRTGVTGLAITVA